MVRSERTTRRFYEGCGRVHAPVSMLFPPIDPNERFRERRAAIRRRKRLRRSAAVGRFLLALAAPRGRCALRRDERRANRTGCRSRDPRSVAGGEARERFRSSFAAST